MFPLFLCMNNLFIIFICSLYSLWATIRLLHHHFGFVMCVNFRLCCTHFSCHWRRIRNVSWCLMHISKRQCNPCPLSSHKMTLKQQINGEKLWRMKEKTYLVLVEFLQLVRCLEDWQQVSFCGLIVDKGDFHPKMCILCVCVKINKVCVILFVFGSCFRMLAVILSQIFIPTQFIIVKFYTQVLKCAWLPINVLVQQLPLTSPVCLSVLEQDLHALQAASIFHR